VGRELPFVDAVYGFAAPWVKSAAPASPSRSAALLDTLRAARFDGAVIFTVCTQSALPSALLLTLAGIPRRLAYCRENPYALLTDWQPDPDRDVRGEVRHEVRRQLDLVACIGATTRDERLAYPLTAGARDGMRAKAMAAGADPARPWLVVHPGATAASRRYPLHLLAVAAGMLGRDARWQLVLAGAAEDRDAIEALREAAPGSIALAGMLSVAELAALLEHACVLVCNNSGPAHLAAAVGTPVVDLYALTNPQHTPWGVAHATLSHPVPCHGCLKSTCPEGHHRCLAGIAPDQVVAAVHRLAAAPVARAA
jgi:lipopolysaccharide heptosyltransferase II